MSDCCCKKFERATQPGTDKDGYGAAITETDAGFYIGGMFDDKHRIQVCPWCGADIEANK